MIEFERLPDLRSPVMVAAFEGWNDAGEAATDAIDHLRQVWHARELAEIDPEDYYDFQVTRPHVTGTSLDRVITWPTTRFYLARTSGCDVVLVHGIEPNMRWRAFCAEILGVARDLGVHQFVTLGALLADVPHTRPVPLTASAYDPASVRDLGLEPSSYEGPTGIVGVLQQTAGAAGFGALSLWAAVPHYVGQSPCPKAALALLRHVEDIVGASVPLSDLPDQAAAWERGVDEMASEDEEIAAYVQQLERSRDSEGLPEASGEAIAREFERYLRHREP